MQHENNMHYWAASEKRINELKRAGMDIARINTAYTSKTKVRFNKVMIDVRRCRFIPKFELPKKGIVAISFVHSKEALRMRENILLILYAQK